MLDDRGVSSTATTLLLVVTVIVAAGGVFAVASALDGQVEEPARAALAVDERTIDGGGDRTCGADGTELAVDVRLAAYHQADAITVVARHGEAEYDGSLWSDPGPDDVGTTLTLATADTDEVDVVLGDGDGAPLCRTGESPRFAFYGEYGGSTTLLQRHVV